MGESIVQDPRAANIATSFDTLQDKLKRGHLVTTEDVILYEPPSKSQSIEMKELVGPDSAPIADAFSVYSTRQKKVVLLAGSFAAFFSPVSSNIYFPAVNTIAKDLNVSLSQIDLTITTYQVSMILYSPVNCCSSDTF